MKGEQNAPYQSIRRLQRKLRRGFVPLSKDHKPLQEKPHIHPRSKRQPR